MKALIMTQLFYKFVIWNYDKVHLIINLLKIYLYVVLGFLYYKQLDQCNQYRSAAEPISMSTLQMI